MYLAIFTFMCILSVIIGKSSQNKKLQNIEKDLNFLTDYRNKFVEMANNYYENKSFDNNLYHELIENSNKAQRLLGATGIITYKPPYSNLMYSNYPIALNTIPMFKTGKIEIFDITSTDDTFLRKIGILKERQESLNNADNLKTWFQIGSQAVLSFPLSLLSFFGIVTTNKLEIITTSSLFKIINGIVWLLALLSTIITIFTGWDAFKNILTQ
jgi:hypothetical protein